MHGLDPRIHVEVRANLTMDRRVKPGDDSELVAIGAVRGPLRDAALRTAPQHEALSFRLKDWSSS
jgi:hypothetical protein